MRTALSALTHKAHIPLRNLPLFGDLSKVGEQANYRVRRKVPENVSFKIFLYVQIMECIE